LWRFRTAATGFDLIRRQMTALLKNWLDELPRPDHFARLLIDCRDVETPR
jgi:hypothetical protein